MSHEVLMIVGMMLVTIAPRYGVLALLGRVDMPRPALRALKYVPVAVLSAITLPALLLRQGELNLALENSFLIAGVAAGVIAWRSKNLLLTIVLGMALMLLWRTLFPAGG